MVASGRYDFRQLTGKMSVLLLFILYPTESKSLLFIWWLGSVRCQAIDHVNYGKPFKHHCIISTQNDNIECFNSSLPGQNGSKITDDVLLCQWKLVNLNIFLTEVSSLGVFKKYHWFRSWLCGEQGLVLISDKTSYRKISWSLEATRLVFRIVRLLWNLTGTSAALLPRRLSYFRAIR